jgi:dUTPase
MGKAFYNVTKQVTLTMTIRDHTETITLNVTAVGKHQIILGLPWCQYHCMEFNWENLQIAKWGTKCNETCHLDKELAPLLVKPYTREPACSPPTRATPDSISYDLYVAEELTIPPHSWALVPTRYIIKTPEGTYRRIAPRSRLALRHSIDIATGVIDPDY